MNKEKPSYLYSGNAWFIEDLYESYLADPANVDEEWREYFESFKQGDSQTLQDVPHSPIQQAYYEASKQKANVVHVRSNKQSIAHQQQVAVLQLINAYRFRGHRQADLDPLNQYERPEVPELEPAYHNLSENDMETLFNTGSLHTEDEIPLREIIKIVQDTYCRSIGAEYMHINETEQKRWLQQRLESCCAKPDFDNKKKTPYPGTYHCCQRARGISAYKICGAKTFFTGGGRKPNPTVG